jgi:phosphatidylglycerophosphate synthase
MQRQLPNALTVLRLFLAAGFFITLNQYRFYGHGVTPHSGVIWIALTLFILAAATDYLDGFLARKWKVESQFGRIMDPLCDKILIIGSFMMLAGPRFVIPDKPPHPLLSLNMASGVYPWMVVVILTRELLVTAIRSEMETGGSKFGAVMAGKLKMVLQAIAIPTLLVIVWLDPVANPLLGWVRDILVYLTVLVTILSGLPYVLSAKRMMRHIEPVK